MSTTVISELCAAGFNEIEQIGRGGFGVVYRCTQVGLDRVVAVKVLTHELDASRQRFLREEHAMGRLTGHPNIVAILQVGQTESGYPYLVMPYHRQGTLEQRIRRLGVLELEEVLRVGVKMAGALESAHEAGIVHRDVKPGNILFTDYGDPALSDFGIAHVSGGFKTAAGVFTGSPAFTAPEVLGGDPPSPASDVYGMGATLFCALTGHTAFERRSGEQVVAQFLRIASEPVPDLGERGVSGDVAAVVQAAMVRGPGNRPSARELGEELQELQASRGLVVDEMALQGSERSGRSVRTSPPTTHRLRGNLATHPARLIGRTAELAELQRLLSISRLVTVTGIGGIGKTALATHAARRVQRRFPDGVWLVELADLRDGSLLIEVVAAALGARDQSGRPLTEVLLDFLYPRETLIVLDNCEHIVDMAAKLVEMLLRGCPRLWILATSREVLNVEDESVLPLPPLSWPDHDADPVGLAHYDAVRLFTERARAAVPEFRLTEHNRAAVARICARLDGLPLAIELSAARLGAMSAQQIAEGLSDRYALLTRGKRGAPARQRELAGCIGWSWDLCTEAEQQLWAQLSVFAGTFGLRAANDICGPHLCAEEFLDEVSALVDKSVLVRTEHDGTVGFRLLETLREYGRARIADDAQYRRLRGRHARWYQGLLTQVSADWFGPEQARWIRHLANEMPNIREALQFSIRYRPQSALKMTIDLHLVASFAGMLSEERYWLDLALAATQPKPTAQRVGALFAAAVNANLRGDLAGARMRIAEARTHLEVLTEPTARGRIDFADGFAAMLGGELERAQHLFQCAVETTDDFEVQMSSMTLLGWLLEIAGDLDSGLRWHEKAVALGESRGELGLRSHAQSAVGMDRWCEGQPQQAEQALRQGLQFSHVINNPLAGAHCLEALAWVAESNHDPRRAVMLMAAAAALGETAGPTWLILPNLGGFHDECERRARQQLDTQEFQAAWSQGNALTFEQAVTFALGETAGQGQSPTLTEDSVPSIGNIDRGGRY